MIEKLKGFLIRGGRCWRCTGTEAGYGGLGLEYGRERTGRGQGEGCGWWLGIRR